MKTHQMFDDAGSVAYSLLKITKEAADAFPPLKLVAAVALSIAEIKLVHNSRSPVRLTEAERRNTTTPRRNGTN